eukprot:648893-Alexandrium_andersonii.AAC.1
MNDCGLLHTTDELARPDAISKGEQPRTETTELTMRDSVTADATLPVRPLEERVLQDAEVQNGDNMLFRGASQ